MTDEDLDRLSLWAVRYTLGRMTYAVHDVCEVLARRCLDLSVPTRRRIVAEIEERTGLGMDIDEREWLKLHARLLETLNG